MHLAMVPEDFDTGDTELAIFTAGSSGAALVSFNGYRKLQFIV